MLSKLSFTQLQQKALTPVNGTSIAIFRMGFGLIMLWEVFRYWRNGWISKYYIEPEFYFKYYGFEWIQPWEGEGMYVHFLVMGLLALLITVGAFYRISIILFTLAFSYVFLLDQTRYLNHFYLVILFSCLLCVIPAHQTWSVDAWRRAKQSTPTLTMPSWSIWILRTQMEIMLLYAGIVKINPDWLQLQPLKMWLAERADFPLGLGYLFTQDWAIAVAAYGVIALHIIGAPLLLWQRTRLPVFCIYAAFHSLNHFVFSIGIFPWFTLFATLIFFDPHWPQQLRQKLQNARPVSISTAVETIAVPATTRLRDRLILYVLAIWTVSQILIPLRHVLYPGNVSWTEEGHRFSWQMKLRDKTGWAHFYVIQPGQQQQIWLVTPDAYLTPKQNRKMTTRPDMLLQFAHYLAHRWKHDYAIDEVQVTATVFVSLNGRPHSLLLDPNKDLSRVNRSLSNADWILPLNHSLPGKS
ncbi:MAG: HTTM domain-containing protein [Gammaproteobacteria bacterium]|nr:HTTM domain-containing protein [Gammaproteobacteria bacterium]MDH5801771.1 HTTM domain-containing protein [Gammaproteobacteria bacterium]